VLLFRRRKGSASRTKNLGDFPRAKRPQKQFLNYGGPNCRIISVIIKVDLTKDFGQSSSKKSNIVASTEGNVSVPDRQENVGLNVYRTK